MITVLAVPAMILAAGLVVDAGAVIWAKAVAQSAADLAALAAVQEIDLDRLASGERWLVEPDAMKRAVDVARDNLARGGGALGAESAVVRVRVFNMSEGETERHHGDGRLLRDPTVCVTVEVRPRLVFLSPLKKPETITAHADASVVARRK
ncbi:MAG: pilus assembly protein TadG-related protein [Ignavibacteriales bacterium]